MSAQNRERFSSTVEAVHRQNKELIVIPMGTLGDVMNLFFLARELQNKGYGVQLVVAKNFEHIAVQTEVPYTLLPANTEEMINQVGDDLTSPDLFKSINAGRKVVTENIWRDCLLTLQQVFCNVKEDGKQPIALTSILSEAFLGWALTEAEVLAISVNANVPLTAENLVSSFIHSDKGEPSIKTQQRVVRGIRQLALNWEKYLLDHPEGLTYGNWMQRKIDQVRTLLTPPPAWPELRGQVVTMDPQFFSETERSQEEIITGYGTVPIFWKNTYDEEKVKNFFAKSKAAGLPIVVTSMGSLPSQAKEGLMKDAVDIALSNQARVLMISGWGNVGTQIKGVSENLEVISYGPYDELASLGFDAFVTHGGTGSVHTMLLGAARAREAGKKVESPVMGIVEHILDQRDNAERLQNALTKKAGVEVTLPYVHCKKYQPGFIKESLRFAEQAYIRDAFSAVSDSMTLNGTEQQAEAVDSLVRNINKTT